MEQYDGNGSGTMIAVAEHPSASYMDVATARQNLNALKMRHNLMVDAMKEVLREDIDYGKIPGTGDKPTLLKAGAENLSFLFGLRPAFELVDCIEDWDGGLFYYRYRCTLNDGNGRAVANSEGSCNSRETKYRYRTAKQVCPECGADTISKSKYPPRGAPNGTPNGWWCRTCKTDFAHNDKRITGQELGKVENPEPFELVNTLQKMAQKRALVAAVLVGTGASQFFTQDIEDMATITIDAEITREVDAIAPTRLRPEIAPPEVIDEPDEPAQHWIKDETTRKRFWAWSNEQGLSRDDVHWALGVEHVEEFAGDKAAAVEAIRAWMVERREPEEDDVSQPDADDRERPFTE